MTRRRVPTLAEQAVVLRERFPDSTIELTPKRLRWTGRIQPTVLSRTYVVRITYARDLVPQVRVLDPPLRGRPGERLPHVYRGPLLCLHLPGEWTDEMHLATTTIPWASAWLAFYEIWLATGNWLGGGTHELPDGDALPARNRRWRRLEKHFKTDHRRSGQAREVGSVLADLQARAGIVVE